MEKKTSIDQSGKKQSEQGGKLAVCVRKSVKRYLKDLNGEEANRMYEMVLQQVEKPLLEVIMKQSNNNQSKASRMLGINRNTLRKKLGIYNIGKEA